MFRVLGAVLLLGGLFFLIRGGVAFAGEMNADSFGDDPGFGPILSIAAGGFMIVFGLAALNAGFLGAQARYASGEVAPSVRESRQRLPRRARRRRLGVGRGIGIGIGIGSVLSLVRGPRR